MTKTTKEKAAEAGAKIPNDHAVKAAEAEATGGVIEAEVRGFTLTIDPDDLSDFRLWRRFYKGDQTASFELFERLYGEHGDAVLESVADDRGRVSADIAGELVREASEAASMGKSQAS